MRDPAGLRWTTAKSAALYVLAACFLLSSWSAAQDAVQPALPGTCDLSRASEAETRREMPDFVGCLIDDVGESFTQIVIEANLVAIDSDKRTGEIVRQSFAPGTSFETTAASGRKLSLFYSRGPSAPPERARIAMEDAKPVVEGETLLFIVRKYPPTDSSDVIGFTVQPESALIEGIDPPSPLTFASGDTELEIRIKTSDDPVSNGPQKITVQLNIVDAYATIADEGGMATGIVNDRVVPPGFSISVRQDSVPEGEQLRFRVTRTGDVSSESALRYTVTRDDGTGPIERPLTFRPGDTELPIDDVSPTDISADTMITVTLFATSGETPTNLGSASGMIYDQTAPPTDCWYDPLGLGWPWCLFILIGSIATLGGVIWFIRRWPPFVATPVVHATIISPIAVAEPQPGASYTLPDVHVEAATTPGAIHAPTEFPFTILEDGDDRADHD